MGLPAPIDVQVSGQSLKSDFEVASQIAAQARALPGVSDVLIPQDIDYPALQLDVDREEPACSASHKKRSSTTSSPR